MLDPSIYEVERLGIEVQGSTQRDNVCFTATGPVRQTNEMVKVLSEVVSSPIFDKSRFGAEKRVVREEIMSTEGWDHLEQAVKQSLWRGHPIGQPIAGSVEDVLGFELAHVESWYEHLFVDDRLTVVVCSPFEPSAQRIKLDSGTVQPRRTPEASINPPILEEVDEETYTALLSWPVEPRDPAVYLLPSLLVHGYTSLLQSTLVSEYGFAYDIHAAVDDYGDVASFDLGFECSPESFAPMCDHLMSMLMDWTPTYEDLHRARTLYQHHRRMEAESPENRVLSVIDNVIAGAPEPNVMQVEPEDYLEFFEEPPQVGIRGPLKSRILSRSGLV